MRIISGKYRGRPLVSFEGKDVRPTIDRVKESIFNVIQFGIKDSNFVDLFSGTGSIGIEAISRGAKEVIFSDNAQSSINIIKQNLKGIEGEYKLLNRDYRETLNSLAHKVDYIFVDAPYALDCINNIIDIVKNRDLLLEDGYIIYEHDVDKRYKLPQEFFVEKVKTFGKVQVDYIKHTNTICAVTGSFDPITLGHIDIIEKALNDYDKVVVVIAQNEEKPSFFKFEDRKKIVDEAIKDFDNAICEVCEGYVYPFLNERKINIIARGYRTEKDLAYEKDMAKYNKDHGNLDTVFYEAKSKDCDISSTKVRQALENNLTIKGLVPKNIEKIIKKLYEVNKLW